jgi:hypothetical protein
MKPVPIVSLLFALMAMQCRLVGPEQWNRDYYYVRGHVQIQGTAALPPVKQYIQTEEGNRTVFLSLQERREDCLARALKQSHLKWLAMRESDQRSQTEWDLALRQGETGPWSRCLAMGRVEGVFFDAPEQCRVAVLYPCLPSSY